MKHLSNFILSLITSANLFAGSAWEITKIRIDHGESPIHVASASPGFSWILSADGKNQRQTAYRIQIADNQANIQSGIGNIANTEKITSSESTNVHLSSLTLKSNTDYWVKITAWNQDETETSAVSNFSTSLLSSGDWKAQWIGIADGIANAESKPALDDWLANRTQYLRKSFQLNKEIKRARAFVSGVGQYELSINGNKIGDFVLAPAKTHYSERTLFDVFDVKNHLSTGDNAVGIHLAQGWYSPIAKYVGWRMSMYGLPRAILQLEVEYADGSKEQIVSDQTWKAGFGPVIFNSIYDGETYDARLESPNWDKPGFDDACWIAATVMDKPCKELKTQTMPPERVIKTFTPAQSYRKNASTVIYDMGQNFSGWTKIKVTGSKGATVKIRHAEQINAGESPTLNVSTNREALNTDIYILKGEDAEEYEPRFTCHGFRYAEVSVEGNAEIAAVTGRVVATDVAQTSALQTDNDLINHIHHCTLWSQISNMQGLPTDCPQRDERLGWVADGYVTADEAMLNFDAPLFYQKWINDMRTGQSADGRLPHIAPSATGREETNWSCGYIIVLGEYYRNYGDLSFVEEHYPSMLKYIYYLRDKRLTNYIVTVDRYGDWCTPAQDSASVTGWVRGTPVSSTTMMYYYCIRIVEQFARIFGKTADAETLAALKANVANALNANFYDTQTKTYTSEPWHFQYAQGLPLCFGFVPDSERSSVLNNLINDILVHRNGHLYAGIIGARYIPELLDAAGRNDVVYQMVTAEGYPGWKHLLNGFTTFPEYWSRKGSLNHVMFGSIDAWFFRSLAGIKTDSLQTGYKAFKIKPFFPESGLNTVNASIETPYGKIASSWQKTGKNVIMNIEIPVNTSATIVLPEGCSNVLVDGQAKPASFDAGSGKYQMSFTLK